MTFREYWNFPSVGRWWRLRAVWGRLWCCLPDPPWSSPWWHEAHHKIFKGYTGRVWCARCSKRFVE